MQTGVMKKQKNKMKQKVKGRKIEKREKKNGKCCERTEDYDRRLKIKLVKEYFCFVFVVESFVPRLRDCGRWLRIS